MYKALFEPKSIALVGASRHRGKLGYEVLHNITSLGYKGEIYPVNPKAKSLLGHKAYPSVLSIPGTVDLAIIVVPAPFVLSVLEECGKKKVKGVVVISAGFKETGEAGRLLEEQVVQLAHKYRMHLVGPNCLGILNPLISLNASFAKGMPRAGNVGLLSQSGAMAVAITDWAKRTSIGFSKIVSLGNKADLTEAELLTYLGNDKKTEVVLLYLESISQGPAFLEAAKRVALKKPIIVIKAGTTQAGQKAISSHTGSLAGEDVVTDAAFRDAGIVRARTVEEFFDYAELFARKRSIAGNRIAIITNAGGPGVLATDALIGDTQLQLASLSEVTKTTLATALPPAASVHNPVDILGDALSDRYEKAFAILFPAKEVDGLVVLLTPQVMTEEEKTAELLIHYSKKYPKKPITVSFMGGETVRNSVHVLEHHDIPHYSFPHRGVKALNALYSYEQAKLALMDEGSLPRISQSAQKEVAVLLDRYRREKRTVMSVEDVRTVLTTYGIGMPLSLVVKDEKELLKALRRLDYPLVMKIESPDILHKSDVGGVALNISSEQEARLAFRTMLSMVGKKLPKARIKGVSLQHMYSGGVQTIVGMKRDTTFGPCMMFGLGGVFVEIMKDVSFALAPLGKNRALRMMQQTKGIRMLEGYRGTPVCDKKGIVGVLTRLSLLAHHHPSIQEMDVNPLLVYGQKEGVVPLDVKIVLG